MSRRRNRAKDSVTLKDTASSLEKETKIGVDNIVPNDSDKRPFVVTNTDPTKDYIVARYQSMINSLLTMPSAFDDLTREFGPEFYSEKMMSDPEVSASVGVLVLAVTAKEASFSVPIDKGHKDYKIALDQLEFMKYCFNSMESSVIEVVKRVLDGLVQGHSLSKIVFKYVDDRGVISKFKSLKGNPYIVTIKSIRKKPVCSYALVVDSNYDLIGAVPTLNRQYYYSNVTALKSGDNEIRGLIPKDELLVFTWDSKDGSPQGRSILSPVYTAWWIKTQAWSDWMTFLGYFSKPSIYGTPPKDATGYCDENGNQITATEALHIQLQNFQNASVGAFPHGTEIKKLEINANGSAFEKIIELANREIIRGVLNQHLATGESANSSRSQAETHQETLGLKIMQIKNQVCDTIQRQVINRLVSMNWGDEYLHCAPEINLGVGDGFPLSIEGVSSLIKAGWTPDDSQWKILEDQFGLPSSQEDTQPEKKEAKNKNEANRNNNDQTANNVSLPMGDNGKQVIPVVPEGGSSGSGE